jgi:Cellulase (glycosyl hydrolase family 5)
MIRPLFSDSVPPRLRVRILTLAVLSVALVCRRESYSGEPEFIRVSDDKRGFVLEKSGQPFVPWGFNYDHDEAGRLIEDYWDTEWPKVEEDFAEMKRLGANVVRIHIQFGKFMEAADKPNAASLEQLGKLLKLAEKEGLHIDLTGLGCYHKRDVPRWYDELDEAGRWKAQARFWEAVAERCAASPAIFCYDLMNEPVVPGSVGKADDWLGPPLGDKHFVQRIALEAKGRERPAIARAWIEQLVAAIRKHDRRHLVTVGLVPWSLDRPGLTSGFVPAKIAEPLDFVCVHLYPESGKVAEELETLKGFNVGKPVVIEEMFPLKCSADELGKFIDDSKPHAAGWIGFYWGKTPDQYRAGNAIADAITLKWLELFERQRKKVLP